MRKPIYDQNTERLMLILCESNNHVSSRITEDHFYSPQHRSIFEAIKTLILREGSCSSVSILREIKASGNNALSSYTADLFASEDFLYSRIEQFDAAFKILSDLKLRREIAKFADNALDEAYTQEDAQGLYTKLKKGISKLSETSSVKLHHAKDIMLDIVETWMNGAPSFNGFKSSYQNIDELITGFEYGEVDIIAGRPSMGKTSFAINLLMGVSTQQINSLFISLEMTKKRIVEQMLSIKGNTTRGALLRQNINWDAIHTACNHIASMNILIDDVSRNQYQILESIHSAVRAYNVKEVLIDYFQLISFKVGYGQTRSSVIGVFAYELLALAKELGIHITLLCQLNRDSERREGGKPIMSDLRDSGELEQVASKVLMVFNPFVFTRNPIDEGKLEIIIAKNRGGKPGSVELGFNESTGIFNLY